MSVGDVCAAMPKVELHAHLHGCVRDGTLRELLGGAAAAGPASAAAPAAQRDVVGAGRTLEECFEVFGLVHRAVSSLGAVARVTAEAVEDFRADGVRYLELRSTPRALGGASARDYVETVLRAARGAEAAARGEIDVRLVLSVNRRRPAGEARETLRLAREFAGRGVVGVEVSGDPSGGPSFGSFAPLLGEARACGLGTSVHVGEVWRPRDTREVCVDFRPDRLGHAVLLEPDVRRALERAPIPVEVCPTSNVRTVPGLSLSSHPFGVWEAAGYPLAVCTDDPGVFGVTLSGEYRALAAAHGLSAARCVALAEGAADHIFDRDPAVRRRLAAAFAEFRRRPSL